MYTFKGKVKTLEVIDNNGRICEITFDYADVVSINKVKYGIAYNSEAIKLCTEILKNDDVFTIEKNNKIIYDFISQHMREVLEVTFEEKEINGSQNEDVSEKSEVTSPDNMGEKDDVGKQEDEQKNDNGSDAGNKYNDSEKIITGVKLSYE